jgi:hypothetical protein
MVKSASIVKNTIIMHGLVFQQLQQFVTKNHGAKTWNDILDNSQVSTKSFLPTKIYDDAEALSIVSAASALLKAPASTILESFGEFIAGNLIKIYAFAIKPEWRTLDLVEHTENSMHKAVRFNDKEATPPALVCKRVAPNKVLIEYKSERKMIDLGVGIIKGFATHYNEKIDIKRRDVIGITTLEVTRMN